MTSLEIKEFAEIRDDIISRLTTLSDKITDFNVGSVVRSIIVAFAAEMDEGYYKLENAFNQLIIPTSSGDNLDNITAGFGVSRSGAQKAYGEITFTRDSIYTSNIIIPEGTEVGTEPEANENQISFELDEACTLLAGEVACSGAATATETGVAGNVREGTITRILSVVPLIDDTYNHDAFVGGMEAEVDSEYRERFVDTIHGVFKGTVDAVESAAKSVVGIASAKLQESDPSAGYCKLYVATSGGTPTTAEINLVRSEIDGYVRPAGVTFSYYGAVRVGITITATVTRESIYDVATIMTTCEEVVYDYLLIKEMGEDVLRAEIISLIMEVPGVTNVSSLVINGSGSDITINDVQIARPESTTITVS